MTTDERFDTAISEWFEETAPQQLPARVLDATFERTRESGQHMGWRDLHGRLHMRRFVPALGHAAVAVVVAAVALTFYVSQLGIGEPSALPTTPDDWERVSIETPWVTGRVASIAVSPRGLLAVVGGDEPARLAVSTDGRTWTLVPEGQHPGLSNDQSFGMPSVVGTDRGFLLLQLREVWMSENGFDWRRLAGETTDPDLALDWGPGPDTATVGGPGLVAVGGDKAWYSVDGSDWSLAAVPPLPSEILERPEDDRYSEMTGVTAAGNDLVAWGIAEVLVEDNGDEHYSAVRSWSPLSLVVPLLWASHDGRTWASVALPEIDSIAAVAGGPRGFVAAGQAGDEAAVWFSADGEVWERVVDDAFASPVKLMPRSATAARAEYVVVGSDGLCREGPCPGQQVVIWTSVDGRSWTRVPSDDLFSGAQAERAIMWGSRLVIGGVSDGRPAIWISGAVGAVDGVNPEP